MRNHLDTITVSGIRAFSEQYKTRENMVYLTIGEPNLDTPQAIKDAAIKSLDNNNTHYPPAMGDALLREAIAEFEGNVYQEHFSKEHVIITNGATEGLVLAFWSTLSSDDEALILVPSFPLYQSQVELVGAKPVLVDISEDGFQITKERLFSLVSEKTKCLVLASPNNPTGTVLSQDSYDAIEALMLAYPDIYVIVDEVYRTMVYDIAYRSIREHQAIRNRIILVSSFSKSHAMTGWRVGYVIAPVELVDRMHKLHQNIVTGISSFTQTACIEALKVDTSSMVDEYHVRRDFILKSLDSCNVKYVKPEGAFYVFPDISEFGLDSIGFSQKMADDVGLVVVPGIYFGNDHCVRISYGGDMQTLKEGMTRFMSFVTSLR